LLLKVKKICLGEEVKRMNEVKLTFTSPGPNKLTQLEVVLVIIVTKRALVILVFYHCCWVQFSGNHTPALVSEIDPEPEPGTPPQVKFRPIIGTSP
jgi:hypothetical protein